MARDPFTINYMELDEVIAYAVELGKGMLVVKYPERPNYNITHADRILPERVKVLFRT